MGTLDLENSSHFKFNPGMHGVYVKRNHTLAIPQHHWLNYLEDLWELVEGKSSEWTSMNF